MRAATPHDVFLSKPLFCIASPRLDNLKGRRALKPINLESVYERVGDASIPDCLLPAANWHEAMQGSQLEECEDREGSLAAEQPRKTGGLA